MTDCDVSSQLILLTSREICVSTVEGVRVTGGVDHLTPPPLATADSQEKKKKLRGCRLVEKVTVRWGWNRNGEEKKGEQRIRGKCVISCAVFLTLGPSHLVGPRHLWIMLLPDVADLNSSRQQKWDMLCDASATYRRSKIEPIGTCQTHINE